MIVYSDAYKIARLRKEHFSYRDARGSNPRKKKDRRLDIPTYGQAISKVTLDEDALAASVCLDSFYDFVKEFWHEAVAEKPVWNWHIKYICDQAQKVCERIFAGKKKKHDLCINIAPGTTKSLILSIMLPAWCLARMPSFRFIGASYSYPLAMDLSTRSRDVVKSDKYHKYFPQVVLREDQDTKGYFKTINGGFRYAVGVNGAITGLHAHLIVIDDPLNPQQALSVADIAAANHWIKHTLSNRKVDKAISVMILVMQRLHQDDPTTQFISRGHKRVRHIKLPAEYARNTDPTCRGITPWRLYRKYKHRLTDPVRLNREILKEEKKKGEYYYSSQFLQDPVPAGGGMFKTSRLTFAPTAPQLFHLVRFWDKAATSGGGSYTVGTKMGMDQQGRVLVVDVVRGQWDSAAREDVIERTAELDGPEVKIGVEQEPGSGGKDSAEWTAKRLAGFIVEIIKVDGTTGGKERRADPRSSMVNAGHVNVLMAGWNHEWVEEHRYFPFSRYKDQVDSASLAFSTVHKPRVRCGGWDASPGYVEVSPAVMSTLNQRLSRKERKRQSYLTSDKYDHENQSRYKVKKKRKEMLSI